MIPATQNAPTTLQKHCGRPPAAHNAARAGAPAAARRTRPALSIFHLTAKIRDLAENAVFVDRGRGRVGGEGVGARG